MNTQALAQRPSKIVCVGRSYADHAKELGNAVPERPVLFIKPPSSLGSLQAGITWNSDLGECHFECELCLKIAKPLSQATDPEEILASIAGVTLGLDLTMRELQTELKNKGQPWERAKAFNGSCILADWVDYDPAIDLDQLTFTFAQNGEIKQRGNTQDLIFTVVELLIDINQAFALEAGDVIMTGTPAGVGALHRNDQLEMTLNYGDQVYQWQTFCR